MTPLALLLLLSLAGCWYHVTGSLSVHFQVYVKTAEKDPIKNAKVWIRHLRFSPDDQPRLLRSPICVTDAEGACSALISYRFEFETWEWPIRLPTWMRNERVFLVGIQTADSDLVWAPLPRLSGAQYDGYEGAVCDLVLSPGTSWFSSEEELIVTCEGNLIQAENER
jgi:hypothetical protein